MIRTPVTVFNGFLGSGKTSIILQLIRQLPPNYKAVFLKNEFGDQAVDSQLAKLSNISGINIRVNIHNIIIIFRCSRNTEWMFVLRTSRPIKECNM
jgi:Ni2+-binding GTPase involved in maturation of urease and hydrogenase